MEDTENSIVWYLVICNPGNEMECWEYQSLDI